MDRSDQDRSNFIGIISDVHCNLASLYVALELMGPVAMLIVAGDAVSDYRYDATLLRTLREADAQYVRGNHEDGLLRHGSRALASATDEDVEYLQGLPWRLDLQFEGKRLTVVHGSPWEPHDAYLYDGDPRFGQVDELGADFLVLGHTHRPMVRRIGRTLIVNPGSLGEPSDSDHAGKVSFALLDVRTEDVEIIRFDDPRLPMPPARR